MLKNKAFSILGDSISTYRGISDDREANATLIYNPPYYHDPFPLEKTYWGLLMSKFGLKLCVNNSWSGGNLTGRDHPDSGVCRVHNLSRDDGTDPEFIIVFMGINDLGRGVDTDVFASDYERVLLTIKDKYPICDVCCVNLPDRDPFLKQRTVSFNEKIAEAVRMAGDRFFVADLFSSRLQNDTYYMNTIDGLHPDEDGMRIISEVIEDSIRRNIK